MHVLRNAAALCGFAPLREKSSHMYIGPPTMTSILLFGLLAAAANVLGGLVLIKSGAHRMGERFLKYLVALGAGFMLAAIFIEILPTTIDIWTKSARDNSASESVAGAMTLLLAGY